MSKKKVKRKRVETVEIGTLNVRTLNKPGSLIELEEAFENSNLKILGLAETKRTGEKIVITKKGNLLYHNGNNKRTEGSRLHCKTRNKK